MEISAYLFQQFNAQYNRELGNAYAYEGLGNHADAEAWDGFSKFFRKSAKEEWEHAAKLRDFLVDRNTTPVVLGHDAPAVGGGTPLLWITVALGLEQANTQFLQELEKACALEGDQEAKNYLIWFLDEQRQSERELTDWQKRLQRADTDASVLILDGEIGE